MLQQEMISFLARTESMMRRPEFEVAGRKIGPDHPPYVIAELSANPNRSLSKTLQMIEMAASTGADAINIQTYTADTPTLPHNGPGFRVKGGLWDGHLLHQLYQEAFTPYEWHEQMFARARELGITMFSSPFDESAVSLLAELDAPAYKIASFEISDLPLIKCVAKRRKPIIISTGIADLGEIQEAVEVARKNGAPDVAVLHCTNAYSAPINEENVRTVAGLGQAFGGVSGLSDHSPESATCVAAISLGGSITEKHFTMSHADDGPDAAFSLGPDELKQLVDSCKAGWSALGSFSYSRAPSEQGNVSPRRSLYAVKSIRAGQPFTTENVHSIRPGLGLPPKYMRKIIDRIVARDIAYDAPLLWSAIV